MENQNEQNKNKRRVIIDTNVLSRISDKNFGPQISNILLSIENNPNLSLAISSFSIFELLNECPAEKEKELVDLLNNFNRYEISDDVLTIAGLFGCLVKEYAKGVPISDKTPEHGDKIISANAILSNSLILTLNNRDFWAPFFKEVAREIMIASKNNKSIILGIYLLEPQQEVIEEFLKSRQERQQELPLNKE